MFIPNRLPAGWRKVRLEKISTIQTEIAKNNKRGSIELPYLRVANVQDGFLCLTLIKKIYVNKNKVSRYILKVGNVLGLRTNIQIYPAT